MVIANIAEHDLENKAYKSNPHYQALVGKFGDNKVIPVSVKTEYELSKVDSQDLEEMMSLIGITERSIDTIIQKTYHNLGLITFFTCGPQEAHAWPIKKWITVREAAGEIHSDMQRGFICAEVFNYQDITTHKTEAAMKNVGAIRKEGQDYLVQDGDLLNIKFNV